MILRMFKKTRLTYNCAHLRSTKESLTVDLGKKKRNWLIHDNIGSVKGGAGSVWGCTGWYLVVLGQPYIRKVRKTWYRLVLSGNWVSTMLLCLHIEKSGDLVGCHHSGTDGRTNKER